VILSRFLRNGMVLSCATLFASFCRPQLFAFPTAPEGFVNGNDCQPVLRLRANRFLARGQRSSLRIEEFQLTNTPGSILVLANAQRFFCSALPLY
jgi:hypothetical protein